MFRRPRETKYASEYPKGSIRHVDEIIDLVKQARIEKRPVRLYAVEQMGHISHYALTSKVKLHPIPKPSLDNPGNFCIGPEFRRLEVWKIYSGDYVSSYLPHEFLISHFHKDRILMGSYGISCNPSGEHRLFTHKKLAEEYSNTLRNDPVYVQYVKDWHAYCDRVFEDLDRLLP